MLRAFPQMGCLSPGTPQSISDKVSFLNSVGPSITTFGGSSGFGVCGADELKHEIRILRLRFCKQKSLSMIVLSLVLIT